MAGGREAGPQPPWPPGGSTGVQVGGRRVLREGEKNAEANDATDDGDDDDYSYDGYDPSYLVSSDPLPRLCHQCTSRLHSLV